MQLITTHHVPSVGSCSTIAGEGVHCLNIPHPVTHIWHGLREWGKLEIPTLTSEEYTELFSKRIPKEYIVTMYV